MTKIIHLFSHKIFEKNIIVYPNNLKNREFSTPNSQILSNLKDARESEPCLKDRRDPRLEKQSGGLFLAGWLHGRPQGRYGAGIKSANLGKEKTDSSSCLGIAIIILNFYGKRDTTECIHSVLASSYPHYKIVLVDNDSKDDSVAHLKATFPQIPLIETKANLGYAGGNNVGIRYALE